MRWFLLTPEEYAAFTASRQLEGPPATADATPAACFALVEDEIPDDIPGDRPPTRADWIAAPPNTDAASGAAAARIPVGIARPSDLNDPLFWRLVLQQHPRHPVDLAIYAARQQIAPEIFLNALKLRSDYRTRDEWSSMSELDEDTRRLARQYDFPFNVLRLYNRIDTQDRETWRGIWSERTIKKNLVREMIVDYYDLEPGARADVLKAAVEFSTNWKARSGTFPGDTLRDLVRARRYPRLEENRVRIAALRKEMGLPPKAKLHLPPDLEATHLRLELEFNSIERLAEQLAYFNNERRDQLKNILDLL